MLNDEETLHKVSAGRRPPVEEEDTYLLCDNWVVRMYHMGATGATLERRHPVAGREMFLVDERFPAWADDHTVLWEDSARCASLLCSLLYFLAGQ